MTGFLLLACLVVFVTAKSKDWDDFSFPFNRNSLRNNFHRKYEERKDNSEKTYSICRSQGCFKVASEFWESMNKSVNPCEDFYEYSCGNWPNNNPIPPTEMQWGTMNKMTKEVEYKIRDFLEEEIDSNDSLPIKQVKKFYKSCMNEDELEKTGLRPLEAILFRNGGWPLIMESGEWFEESVTCQQIDDFYSRLSRSAFYSFEITKDKRGIESFQDLRAVNSSMIVLKLPELPPVIKLAHDMEFDRSKMYDDGSYAKFIKEIALAFIEERDANVSEEKLDEDIENLIEFEKKLSVKTKGYYGKPLFGSLEYISDTCSMGESSNKRINWNKTFTNLFFEANIELTGKEEFYLSQEIRKYMKYLCLILEETKPRTIVNYIHWNFLSEMLPHTTSKMRELYYEFQKHLTGVKTQKPRWEICGRNIQMQHTMAYHFVKKYFKESMKDDGMKMFQKIQKAMIKQILRSDWLSDNMKNIELDKIKHMGTIFGYPNWYDDDTAFINYYRGMPIGHQYLDNILMYKKYKLKKKLKNLKNPELDVEWFPTLVNAAYNSLYNELVFPAGLFQYPFYSPAQPETINFGSLGTIMGHEIAHGFDNKGSLFDKNGDLVDWPNEDAKELEKNAMCFYSQYGKFYQIDKNNIQMARRDKTLGEDMADSLGVDIVFEALEEMEKEKNEPRLPGFEDLSNEQIFFLSFAKIWCWSATPEYEKLVKKKDVHSISRYRVIATMQNSEGFSKAFNCPKGSPMNPEEKCRLWRK